MARPIKLLVWATLFLLIGLINASIYNNTGRVYHLVLALVCLVLAVGWVIWSETIRMKQKENR